MSLYDTLGVKKDATPDEIKAAYRKQAKALHPDGGAGDPAKFSQLAIAYRTLGNEEARKTYDETGAEHKAQLTDPVQDRALAMIAAVLEGLINRDNLLQLDLPAEVRNNLVSIQGQAKAALEKGRRNIANLETVAKRLRKKRGKKAEGKIDYMLQMVERRIVMCGDPLRNVQLDVQAATMALDLIDLGYDYTADSPSPQQDQQFYSSIMRRTTGASPFST